MLLFFQDFFFFSSLGWFTVLLSVYGARRALSVLFELAARGWEAFTPEVRDHLYIIRFEEQLLALTMDEMLSSRSRSFCFRHFFFVVPPAACVAPAPVPSSRPAVLSVASVPVAFKDLFFLNSSVVYLFHSLPPSFDGAGRCFRRQINRVHYSESTV